jgi:hypothetical protein
MLGTTVRDFPPAMIYPSICSLTHLDPWNTKKTVKIMSANEYL